MSKIAFAKNSGIRKYNAKQAVKLDYFKRGKPPGAIAGKAKCDGFQTLAGVQSDA
ncbi:hypothetical protein [Salmonella enterica]|uniref:hypothetical protein n=1 Tax=Salmonella enterica TaxID=28901 RepID=UPI003CD00222